MEGSFISSYSALVEDRESYFGIQALEDSELTVIPYAPWRELYESNPLWAQFLVPHIERAFIVKEERERELLLDDAESRYISFRRRYPGLEQRVKQYLIASYLGITPVALSRIRRKMRVVNLC